MVEQATEENIARLKNELRRFLEARHKCKILNTSDGQLRMYVAAGKNQFNSKPKDRIMNFLLMHLEERLLREAVTYEDAIISNFLISELQAFVASSLK